MTSILEKYCLDTNVLIQAWQKYYSPVFFPTYWDKLNQLGRSEIIFLPEEVIKEIRAKRDALTNWIERCEIPIIRTNQEVTDNSKKIFNKDSSHKYLVDNTRARSVADPWVIACAMSLNATVVTKEARNTTGQPKKIKIPNVCDNMHIKCIDDFQMIKELNLTFSCSLPLQK